MIIKLNMVWYAAEYTVDTIRHYAIGLSLLCSKICSLCFLAFPQFSAYYACFYAF